MATSRSMSVFRITKVFAKVKVKERLSISWECFNELLKLANAAQIPLVGGAFGITSELIDFHNSVGANKAACQSLLEVIAAYSELIWQFVGVMSPEYVRDSKDKSAVIARESIVDFVKVLEQTSVDVKKIRNRGRVMQTVRRSSTRDELVECEKRLAQAHARFKDARSNVLVAEVRNLASSSRPPVDEFKIPGVKILPHDVDLDVGNQLALPTRDEVTFWSHVYEAKVNGEHRYVKLYHDETGGEEAFLRDMRFLKRTLGTRFPRLFGYCRDASIPFLVFRTDILGSIVECAKQEDGPLQLASHIHAIYQAISHSVEAVQFLLNNKSMRKHLTRNALSTMVKHSIVNTERSMVLALPDEDPEDSQSVDQDDMEDQMRIVAEGWYEGWNGIREALMTRSFYKAHTASLITYDIIITDTLSELDAHTGYVITKKLYDSGRFRSNFGQLPQDDEEEEEEKEPLAVTPLYMMPISS